MKKADPRLMLIMSMTVFGTLGPFVRNIPVSSGELALYRAVLAALLIGVLRKVFIMYGLSMTSPIDGSIIDTIVPLLVLALSVLLGMDRFRPTAIRAFPSPH